MQDSKRLKNRQQQIRKRLNSIKSVKQLKKIMKSSNDQNRKLINQVKELRDKIQVIMNNRKLNTEKIIEKQATSQIQKQPISQLSQLKNQLKSKYLKMKLLKQELNAKTNNKIEQTQLSKAQNINNLVNVQRSIKQLNKQLEDLKTNHQKLQKTLEENTKESNINQPRIEQLQKQNKSLKNRISQIRKNDYTNQNFSIKVQTNLVENRKKVRQIQSRKSMFDLKQMSDVDQKKLVYQQAKLKRQVQTLKKQVEQTEESQKLLFIEQRKRRTQLQIKAKQLVKKLKQVQIQKTKAQQQNNLWKKKWNDICRAIQNNKNKIRKVSVYVQALEFVDLNPLRRDYAGILNKIRFDDRLILRQDRMSKIIGMMIYEIQRGIVTIQAFYNNGQKTYLPIPQHFIDRCRVTKIECSEGDFFKLFKVKYNSFDNKITKVEIRSNKNIKYQYGEKKQWSDLSQGDTIYGFDIGIKQYPVSIFGSYNYYKGNWLLQGFGVEINQLKE